MGCLYLSDHAIVGNATPSWIDNDDLASILAEAQDNNANYLAVHNAKSDYFLKINPTMHRHSINTIASL